MAIPRYALQMIAPHMKGARVLSLAYPDLLITKEEVQKMFGFTPTRFTKRNVGHGLPDPLPETAEVFRSVCWSFDCVDVARLTNIERIVDLNYPAELGEFDLVLDPGTTEHCFNIGQALMNAAGAVVPGGRIMHLSPMTMINHGFYNLCPTLFHDFYTQNGWTVECLKAHERREDGEYLGDLTGKTASRMKCGPEYGLCVLVQRTSSAPLKFPVQAKYAEMLKAAA